MTRRGFLKGLFSAALAGPFVLRLLVRITRPLPRGYRRLKRLTEQDLVGPNPYGG